MMSESKYITYVKDRRFVGQRQLMIVDLVHDSSFGYMNQYGRVETTYDQGSFDFTISGGQGQLSSSQPNQQSIIMTLQHSPTTLMITSLELVLLALVQF